ILSCDFSPAGTAALAGTSDGKLLVFDLMPLLDVPADSPVKPAVRPDRRQDDSEETRRIFIALRAHTRDVSSCAFSPDGATFVAASLDGTIKLWDASTGKDLYTLIGHTSSAISGCAGCAYSPDGSLIFSVGEQDRMLKLWDAATGQERSVIPL